LIVTEENTMKRIVIIGAGLSGLVAATLLVQKGYHVTILEARDRVGGRTLSKSFGGVAYDLGGQFVSMHHRRLRAWIRKTRLHLVPVHRQPHLRDMTNLQSRSFRYNPLRNQGLPDFDSNGTQDLERAVNRLDKLARSLPQKVWMSEHAEELDYMTTKELFEQVAETSLARSFLTTFFQSLLCFETVQISALCFLDYLRSGGYFAVLHGIDEGGAQSFFVREGAGAVSVRLAEPLTPHLKLNESVSRIQWTSSSVVVETNREVYNCDAVLVTVPPVLYDSLGFQPYLPKEKMILAQRYDLGTCIKTLTFYRDPFWRKKGLSGVTDNDMGPITESYDSSHSNVFVLVGFICAKNANKWMQKSQQTRKRAILRQYADMFQDQAALSPIFYDEMIWNGEEFSAGAYVGVASIGTYSHFGHALQKSYPPIFFAGSETATRYKGYMEGAVESAENIVIKLERFLQSKRK
jgi:monoamine oxidase